MMLGELRNIIFEVKGIRRVTDDDHEYLRWVEYSDQEAHTWQMIFG